MRVSYCLLNCFPNSSLAHHSPCPLKLDDVNQVSCSPTQVSIVLEKESSETEKVVEVERNGVDEEGKRVAGVVLKSSLKKPADSCKKEAKKRRVKWKELVDVREFEPLEAREGEEKINSNPTCTCIII